MVKFYENRKSRAVIILEYDLTPSTQTRTLILFLAVIEQILLY